MGKVVMLDPGHGGYDPGANSLDGKQREKDWTLKIAKRVKDILTDAKVSVYMTRTDDTAPGNADTADKDVRKNRELAGRVKAAVSRDADLFVSIHLNAGGGHGSEVYVYKTSNDNQVLAGKIIDGIGDVFGFHGQKIKDSNFYVLRNTPMPAMLIEVCYIDSVEDMAKLSNKDNFEKVCQSIAKPIIAAFGGTASVHDKPSSANDYDNHAFSASIKKAMESGIMKGTAPNTFNPDAGITRGEMAVLLDRIGLLDGTK